MTTTDTGRPRHETRACDPLATLEYPDGLTLRELRDYLNEIPEEAFIDDESDVWVMTGPATSSPACEIGWNGSSLFIDHLRP